MPLGGANLPDVLLLIAFLGLANAIVWPALFPLALSGLGKLTSTGSALLIMGATEWLYLVTNRLLGVVTLLSIHIILCRERP